MTLSGVIMERLRFVSDETGELGEGEYGRGGERRNCLMRPGSQKSDSASRIKLKHEVLKRKIGRLNLETRNLKLSS